MAREITGYGFRFTCGLSLTKNSADKCCASAADPPFPHIKILFFFLRVFETRLIALLTSFFNKKRLSFNLIDSKI